MQNNKTLPESAEILRLALPLMSKHKVPVTPRNYAVWFEYVLGTKPGLNQKIDAELQSDAVISDDYMAALYDEFIDPGHEFTQLENAQKVFSVIYQSLTVALRGATGKNSEYGKVLAQYGASIANTLNLEELQLLIRDLAKSTQTMMLNNSELLADLDQKRAEVAALQAQLHIAKTEAKTDPLTQLPNRRTFFEEVEKLRGDTSERTHFLLMLDIDNFKGVNDNYGHLFGDEVIRVVARMLQSNVKGKDLLARFGGEEFIVLLPDTASDDGHTVAEQIREIIAKAPISNPRNHRITSSVTVSIGMTLLQPGEQVEHAIARADEALYMAKSAGRNRVHFVRVANVS